MILNNHKLITLKQSDAERGVMEEKDISWYGVIIGGVVGFCITGSFWGLLGGGAFGNMIAGLVGEAVVGKKKEGNKAAKTTMGEKNPFVVLGIPGNLTTAEKRKALREQYAKWNRLKTHRDVKVRQKAEKMHELIAVCEREISKNSF